MTAKEAAGSAGSGGAGGFVRGLGLFDAVMIVAGSMIGSGIFIVSAEISRRMGSAGWLLATWLFAGLLIIFTASSFGEVAARMPRVGGPYVYLKETLSPLWGFLFGWAMFLVVQTGTIAAVAVAFSRFLGLMVPAISGTSWIVPPIPLTSGYAVSLSTQQLTALLLIAFLTWVNTHSLQLGKLIQNSFTVVKTLALAALILAGFLGSCGRGVLAANFTAPWTPVDATPVVSPLPFLPPVSAADGGIALLIAFCVALVGALFSSSAWSDISFAGEEVRNPSRNLPRSLVGGTVLVTTLYLLANLAYLSVLPLAAIQHVPEDRVATAVLEALFGPVGATLMAGAIVFSTFGCLNGLILAGARIDYAMAQDGLFFRAVARLNAARVPAMGLVFQGVWACLLVLPRTVLRDPAGVPLLDAAGLPRYGNLYSNLLEYVVSVLLLFNVLTLSGVFILRRRTGLDASPSAAPLYRAFGYPWIPALCLLANVAIVAVLLLYRTQTTWPGVLILLTGFPAYAFWRWRNPARGRLAAESVS